jgi:YVTN family beta-propeller protein
LSELPSGTVTFVFTDIEGSTRLLKQLGDRYGEALADHQRILREAFDEHGGREIDTQGDSFFIAFSRAKDAVLAVVAAQRGLAKHPWSDGAEVRVRVGIHTGEPTVGEERYIGLGVHRAARICGAAHGGQVLVSQTTRELLRDQPLPEISLRDLGEHLLKDLDEPERLYQLVAPDLAESFPPLRTAGPTPFAGREGELAEAATEEMVKRWRRPGRRVLIVATLAAAAIGAGIGVLLTRGGGSTASASVGANALGVIDADSGKVASQIPVGAAPAGVAAGSDAIWVTNADDQTVSLIDPDTNAVVQTIRVGAGPAGIAIGAGAVWVVNALDGTLSRIDPETRAVVQTTPVGNAPTAIAYGLGALWVANAGDATVSEIDPKSGDLLRRLGAGPGASRIATGFRSVWVTSERTGNISRLNPKTGAVRTINVGNGPRAVAVGAGSVWVANTLDGTVSRVDPTTNSVEAVIRTAAGPSDIAVGEQTVWVANDVGASLTRIDAATDRAVDTIRIGNRPNGVALAGGSVLVSVRGLGLAHRGGTLTVYSGRRGLGSIDPSLSFESYTYAIPSLTNDGLVAYKHVGGIDGSTLVPDIASSLPLPTDDGKTYTFDLRRGIRYSTGRVVRAEDFRRAIERLFRLASPARGYYTGIVGGERCAEAPKRCDLSKGIVIDAADRSVTFRLVAPDPDFLYKLALPFANAVPPGIPNRDVGTRPVPATGPYKIAHYVPRRELVFVRNSFFREWSQAARPAGYPDRIVWRLDVKADAATRAVEKGEADVAYDFVPPELLTEVSTRYASQLHVDPIPGTYFYLLDARLRPFNDVRVRRALNYAVDRAAVVELAGAGVAQPTCQVLPPNFPGYRPYCPYTAGRSPSGRWVAPDLDRARRLVAASGTKGQRVQVWATEKAEGEYVATLLRRLGYRTRLRTIASYDKYIAAIFDPGNRVQIAQLRWFDDYPVASGFINSTIFNCSYFCDKRIDRKIERARALQETDTQAANALWARIDRDLTDQAPWLFLYNTKQADFVSSRVSNFQYSLRYGILLDQLWVK